MKKGLIVLTLLMTLGMSVPMQAQKHRHTPRGTELVDTTKQDSGIEAYSDTTSVDSSYSASRKNSLNIEWEDDEDVSANLNKLFEGLDLGSDALKAMIILLVIVIFVFVLSPLLILFLIFYFVNRNRREKMKLAQMAMQNGQPIPDNLLNNNRTPTEEVNDEYQKGLRQCFVGVGLAIFLGFAADTIGFGIGALVFFIGLGKVIAAKTATKKNREIDEMNDGI